MVNQSDLYAFCVIGPDIALSPYKCIEIDMAFDIDECTYPNITTIAPITNYPQILWYIFIRYNTRI